MFELKLPCFVILARVEASPDRPGTLTYQDLVTMSGGPGDPGAVAVFTDRDAATRFRDELAPGLSVADVPTREDFLNVLAVAHSLSADLVFDPKGLNSPAHTATVADVLRCLGGRLPN